LFQLLAGRGNNYLESGVISILKFERDLWEGNYRAYTR